MHLYLKNISYKKVNGEYIAKIANHEYLKLNKSTF